MLHVSGWSRLASVSKIALPAIALSAALAMPVHAANVKTITAVMHSDLRILDPDSRLHLRVIPHQRGGQETGTAGQVHIVPLRMNDGGHPRDPIGIQVVSIIAQLMMHIQVDQQTGSDPDG